MNMEQWIEERMDKLKKNFGDRFQDYEYEWFASMLESAWSRGDKEGSNRAYENVQKWREESK